uniref:Receptor-type tyrosine-protein phosphatase N2 n=1 Tax=Timema douglasi TaxID=61478 RepID=A0A7R8VKA3_TIMDO|nr:unnamed protein product [Timema douglasi]
MGHRLSNVVPAKTIQGIQRNILLILSGAYWTVATDALIVTLEVALLAEWQRRWEESETERRTFKLFLNVLDRLENDTQNRSGSLYNWERTISGILKKAGIDCPKNRRLRLDRQELQNGTDDSDNDDYDTVSDTETNASGTLVLGDNPKPADPFSWPQEKGIEAVGSRWKKASSLVTNGLRVEIPAINTYLTKLPLVHAAGTESEHEMYILVFFMCGMLAAVMVAAAALYLIRRHTRSRDKLNNLTAPDTEASKDYQELCRARMATKSQQDKPEALHVGQRIASLSRESEGSNNSPSSRSSTSSWSEEPALTNMDISTGHMVLSYMEDHLKNKDRLEQEWVGLCAYEAEPCAITLALKPENANKNRYSDILPYDHARLVLNDLTNISGSDYINASTITDHDPRNPAYIATQGALPHTAPDFWQMVWEQGSVVMVHLVSEHIWCDDYLVRSFYLKNLKTGETRTVTQFHFLSWPDGGVPLSTKALLEFRRKVNKSYRGRSCPIVVHCSDGVGRTGTYCLIDMVLNRMAKGAKEIDIAATLEHIRDQRPQMVRTKQQFEFVLMAVAEEVNAILKSLPPQQQQPSQTPTAQQPQQPPAKQQ